MGDFSSIPLIAFLVFALGRPYRGIFQEPQLYIGRAVADLDPSGVGRDLMFVHDGQFDFSLFRFVLRAMVALWGPAMTGEVLAIVAALAWFFAARALARQFVGGGAVWMVVIFAALLPNAYGTPYPFGFAELKAIPRPFAEAFVLAGLAALAARRDVVCLCWPQWASPLQGNPAIFSSALAAEWRNRTQVLMDLRLADQKSLEERITTSIGISAA